MLPAHARAVIDFYVLFVNLEETPKVSDESRHAGMNQAHGLQVLHARRVNPQGHQVVVSATFLGDDHRIHGDNLVVEIPLGDGG